MILVGFVIAAPLALKLIAGSAVVSTAIGLYQTISDIAGLLQNQYRERDPSPPDPADPLDQLSGQELFFYSGPPKSVGLVVVGCPEGNCCCISVISRTILSTANYTFVQFLRGSVCPVPDCADGSHRTICRGYSLKAIRADGRVTESTSSFSVNLLRILSDGKSTPIGVSDIDYNVPDILPPNPTTPSFDGTPVFRQPGEGEPSPNDLQDLLNQLQQQIADSTGIETPNFDPLFDRFDQLQQGIDEISGSDEATILAEIIAQLNNLQNQIAGLNPQITNGLINDLTNLYEQGTQAVNDLLQNNATQLQQLTGIDIPSLRDGLTQISTGQTALTTIVNEGFSGLPDVLPQLQSLGDTVDGIRTKLDECCASGSAEDCCDLIQEIHEALFADIQGAVFFKSCDPEEFNIPTVISSPAYLYAQAAVDVVADGFNRVLDILCELEKRETIAIASVPGHWPTTVTDTDAQLVVQFSEIIEGKETGTAAQLTIPHYGGNKSFPGFPEWRRGSYYARATLTSGRRLQIYADSEAKAIAMINACLAHVGGGYASNPRIVVGQMMNAMSDVLLTPVRAYYYPAGRTSMRPEWCIKANNEPCRGWQVEGATPL